MTKTNMYPDVLLCLPISNQIVISTWKANCLHTISLEYPNTAVWLQVFLFNRTKTSLTVMFHHKKQSSFKLNINEIKLIKTFCLSQIITGLFEINLHFTKSDVIIFQLWANQLTVIAAGDKSEQQWSVSWVMCCPLCIFVVAFEFWPYLTCCLFERSFKDGFNELFELL